MLQRLVNYVRLDSCLQKTDDNNGNMTVTRTMAHIITIIRIQHRRFRFFFASLMDSSSALFPSATREAAFEIYLSHASCSTTFISMRSMDSPCSLTKYAKSINIWFSCTMDRWMFSTDWYVSST